MSNKLKDTIVKEIESVNGMNIYSKKTRNRITMVICGILVLAMVVTIFAAAF